MKIISKNKELHEYYSELTLHLDKLAGFKSDTLLKHYILIDKLAKDSKCLAIRIPGGTVGGIWIDDDYKITDVFIDTNYVVHTYPSDINEKMKKYIGEKIEIDE